MFDQFEKMITLGTLRYILTRLASIVAQRAIPYYTRTVGMQLLLWGGLRSIYYLKLKKRKQKIQSKVIFDPCLCSYFLLLELIHIPAAEIPPETFRLKVVVAEVGHRACVVHAATRWHISSRYLL